MSPQTEVVKKTIPVSLALSILTLVVTAVLFVSSVKADLETVGADPFTGSDMDRFVERLQVTLDQHSRLTESDPLPVPGWRAR